MTYDLKTPDDRMAMPEMEGEGFRTLRIPKGNDGEYSLGKVGDRGTAIIQYEIISEKRDCCNIMVNTVDTSIPEGQTQRSRDNKRITFHVPKNGEDALEEYIAKSKKGK